MFNCNKFKIVTVTVFSFDTTLIKFEFSVNSNIVDVTGLAASYSLLLTDLNNLTKSYALRVYLFMIPLYNTKETNSLSTHRRG